MADSAKKKNKKSVKEERCPVCEGVVVKEEGGGVGGAYPFCSARCRLVDLGKWMKEEYVISRAVEESDIEEGD